MGLGDEIMALGRAETLFEETGQPVGIKDASGAVRKHDAWLGNPAWDPSPRPAQFIVDGPGARPYITRWEKTGDTTRAIFNLDYRPRAGHMHLTEAERNFAFFDQPSVIVAPNLKGTASQNKDWGFENWQAVVKDFPLPVFQLQSSRDEPLLKGVIPVLTPSFRLAAALIEQAAFVMCNEGGTHHMAASMRTPALVIFGAFTPPLVTGYADHENIVIETPEGFCGNWKACAHCKNAMAQITPDMVKERAQAMIERICDE